MFPPLDGDFKIEADDLILSKRPSHSELEVTINVKKSCTIFCCGFFVLPIFFMLKFSIN